MLGLDPSIHPHGGASLVAWILGSSPRMTTVGAEDDAGERIDADRRNASGGEVTPADGWCLGMEGMPGSSVAPLRLTPHASIDTSPIGREQQARM